MSRAELEARAADTERRRNLRRSRSRERTMAGVLWALVPIVTLGFGTPAVFLFGAVRRRSAVLGAAAALYGAVLIAAIVYGGNAPENSPQVTDLGFALIVLALGGSAHAFAVRRSVFSDQRPGAGRGQTAKEPGRVAADAQRAAIEQWEQTRKDRARARSICERDPQEALELFIGRPDLPDSARAFADGGLVDVNNVPAWRLTTSLGIRRPMADRIVAARAQIDGFDSLDDLSVALALPPKLLDTVADRLVFLPLLPANHGTD